MKDLKIFSGDDFELYRTDEAVTEGITHFEWNHNQNLMQTITMSFTLIDSKNINLIVAIL